MNKDPDKILLINFGQLGDVILSLPAMAALARRYERSHITALVGKATAELVRLSGLFDEVVELDRVRLLRGPKLRSSLEIINFARSVRRRRFDFVIDLHSLPETNLLGYFSGARQRFYVNRESRSLDLLSNFRPPAPAEDKSINVSLNYLRSVEPLGIDPTLRPAALRISEEARAGIRERYLPLLRGRLLVALNPGAGHESRRWRFERFVELANELAGEPGVAVAVLLGPEEAGLLERGSGIFSPDVIVPPVLPLEELAAFLEMTDLIVTNDTGVMHLAALMEVRILLLTLRSAPERFLPFFGAPRVLRGATLDSIAVEEVLACVCEMLGDSTDEHTEEHRQPEKDRSEERERGGQ